MSANFHPLVYLIDYIMGMIMWTLIGRVAMNIFQKEDSNFFFMKVFVKLTDPFINIFRTIFIWFRFKLHPFTKQNLSVFILLSGLFSVLPDPILGLR